MELIDLLNSGFLSIMLAPALTYIYVYFRTIKSNRILLMGIMFLAGAVFILTHTLIFLYLGLGLMAVIILYSLKYDREFLKRTNKGIEALSLPTLALMVTIFITGVILYVIF